MQNPITYDTSPGTRIEGAISDMLTLAKEHNTKVTTIFNDNPITVSPDDKLPDVLENWNAECNRRRLEYEQSLEYIASKLKHAQELQQQKDRVAELLNNPPDFTDLNDVITWLEELMRCDYINIKYHGIVELFNSKGFYPNVNTGSDFKENDKENWARYLIGQALDGIQSMGAIPPIYEDFAQTWRNKFL